MVVEEGRRFIRSKEEITGVDKIGLRSVAVASTNKNRAKESMEGQALADRSFDDLLLVSVDRTEMSWCAGDLSHVGNERHYFFFFTRIRDCALRTQLSSIGDALRQRHCKAGRCTCADDRAQRPQAHALKGHIAVVENERGEIRWTCSPRTAFA